MAASSLPTITIIHVWLIIAWSIMGINYHSLLWDQGGIISLQWPVSKILQFLDVSLLSQCVTSIKINKLSLYYKVRDNVFIFVKPVLFHWLLKDFHAIKYKKIQCSSNKRILVLPKSTIFWKIQNKFRQHSQKINQN